MVTGHLSLGLLAGCVLGISLDRVDATMPYVGLDNVTGDLHINSSEWSGVAIGKKTPALPCLPGGQTRMVCCLVPS